VVAGDPPSVAFAKTTRPAIGSIVPRERLFTRLDGAPGRIVAWISGPPGSGKTSLAASYLEARRYRVLWYQIDPDDADVATFFHYLSHAARKLDGSPAARDLPAFSPQLESDVASFSRKFFRQLFARAKAGVALVLDNLHVVPPESPLHAALEAAFSQIPKNSCLIVTSRSDPPPSFARLRVTGEMVCIGWESLRIEGRELAEIAKLRGHVLHEAAVSQLQERTQGWAAGIVLMLEHVKLSGRIAELPGDAAPRAIFDYLAGEIFNRFEPKTQQFLLRIACLPRMTAGIAEALSGEPKAARLLLNLALNDYFVNEVPSEDGRVYQMHPLLRDFLRSRAAQELPEALAADQLQRAAALLRGAGHLEDAVSLLIESRSWAEIAKVVGEEAYTMLAQGRSETLGGWLDLLPAELLGADPRLLHAFGICRVHISPRAARRFFERAFEGFRSAGDAKGMSSSCCGVIDAVVREFDDLTQLDHWIGVLEGSLGQGAPASAQALDSAAATTLVRAVLLRDPGNPGFDARLAQAERAAAADIGDMASEVRAELSLARVTAVMLRGDYARAGVMIEDLGSRSQGAPARARIALAMAAAVYHVLMGAHQRALDAAHEALAAAEAEGMHSYDGWLRAIAAAALLGTGDRDAARSELQILEASAVPLRRGDRSLVSYLRAWLAWLDGDAALAQREARAAVALTVETGIPVFECLARVAWAQLAADGNDRRGCEAQLRAAAALAARARSPLLRFAVELAAADAARQAKDEPAALRSLAQAFALGREHGFDYVPWWRSRAVAELCEFGLRHAIEPQYARALVRARSLVPRTPPLRVRGWPWPYSICTLGRVEIARDGAPVEFSGKGPGRPVELLKVLLALGGHNIRADQLADALWPHVDADYAYKSFTATLHRLRRLLGDDDALTLRDGRLGVNAALIWLDTWALEQLIADLDDALRAPAGARPDLKVLTDDLFALYRGPFLPDESEQPSYIACREQMRARLLRCLARIARSWEEAGRMDAASDCYVRLIEADALFEAPYRNLMLLYQRGGEPGEARAVYERLRTILAMRLKTMPSSETQAVFAGLGIAASR
jgi:LuxR family maltose regulon positive regulatory protein